MCAGGQSGGRRRAAPPCCGADEISRSRAIDEVFALAAVAAKFHLVALAYTTAVMHDARQSWMTWANRALTLQWGLASLPLFEAKVCARRAQET